MTPAKILLVEDDVIVAKDLESQLSKLGYDVVGSAVSFSGALQEAERVSPDLVLMDIQLRHRKDGIDAARVLRHHYDLAVVFMTAYSDPLTLRRATETEPAGYLLKPFDERELSTAIEIALYRHEAGQSTRRMHRWHTATMNSIGDAVIATDLQGQVTFMNPAAELLTGWSGRDACGRPLDQVATLIEVSSRRPLEGLFQRAISEGIVLNGSSETLLIARNGTEIPIEGCAAPIRNDDGTRAGAVSAFRDITDKRRAETELKATLHRLDIMVNADPLTGVLNRRGLEQLLHREATASLRHGGCQLILLDLDDFKRINDSWGLVAGDAVLKEVSRRLTATLRSGDHLVRVGGDEFIIVLPQTRPAEAAVVAERCRLTLTGSVVTEVAGHPVHVTASLGMATLPMGAVSVDAVLEATQQTLRMSKNTGKNRVNSADGSGGLAGVLESLQRAENYRAVSMPIVDLATECVVGYEFLSRIVLPNGFNMAMPDLLHVAREHRMLTLVDRRCLEACVSAASRVSQGLRVHLNLLPSTLLSGPVEALLSGLALKHGLRYCTEISEQQIVGAPVYLKDAIRALRQAGLCIALDEVGFGRSSLESLVSWEPEIVKIDKSRVSGVAHDHALQRSLKALLRLLDGLGSEVIADGIENREDLEFVKSVGISRGQGFLWGHPPAHRPGSRLAEEGLGIVRHV
jgi:diguanylate cyclase (GGDEF)-like protein/PAS domain S-box-containing protein